jgi:FixJ family two-component response regulator
MARSPVIAIIEDDNFVREAMDALLSSCGYRTEQYESAEDFIECVALSEAACLVSDVQLVSLSGIEMGRHLYEIGYTVPIIFVTGANDEVLRKQAKELGCIGYFAKPVAPKVLLDSIVDAVGRPATCH